MIGVTWFCQYRASTGNLEPLCDSLLLFPRLRAKYGPWTSHTVQDAVLEVRTQGQKHATLNRHGGWRAVASSRGGAWVPHDVTPALWTTAVPNCVSFHVLQAK